MKINIYGYVLSSIIKSFKNLKLSKGSRSLRITADHDGVKISVFNNSSDAASKFIKLEAKVYCKVMERGEVFIPEDLIPVLANINGEVTITDTEIIYPDGKVRFAPGEGIVKDIFPECPNLLMKIQENELLRVFKSISYAADICNSRPALDGINFESNKAAALDGYRLAITEGDFDCKDSIIIHLGMVKILEKLLDKKSNKIMQIYTDSSKEYMSIKLGDYSFYSELIKEEYMKYASLINDNCNIRIKVNAANLYSKTKEMFKLNKNGKEIARFKVTENILTLSQVSDVASMSVKIPIEILEGNQFPFEIHFNPYYYAQSLKKHSRDVEITFTGTCTMGMLIKADKDTDLVLPVRMVK